MKAFSFRLERLLRLREEAEQRQAAAVGAATRKEATLDRLCQEQLEHLHSVGEKARRPDGERTSAGMLQSLHLTSLAATSQLENAERARAEARETADAERERLVAAQRDRRTLERLKENQRTTWRGEQARDERLTMDEIAGRRDGGRR